MTSEYEIAVLYHPDLEVDLTKAEQKFTKILADSGGEITATDNWGKRKLAYIIKKQDYGIYVFYRVNIAAQSVRQIETTLNITDEVIRFLITKVDHKELAKAEAQKADKAAKQAARGENARDDDLEDKDEQEYKPRRRSE